MEAKTCKRKVEKQNSAFPALSTRMEGTGVSVQPVSMFQRFGFYSAVQSCELHPAMDAALYGELCIPTNARPGEASFQSVLEDVSVGGLFCVFRGLNIGIIRV